MKSFFHRTIVIILCAAMIIAMFPAAVFAGTESKDAAQRPFRVLSVDEMVAEMGTGWNLGNTFDGHTGFTPNETLWQTTTTYQELIDAVHDAGFNTVRIPVTWGTMINDDDYSIDEKWINRVQDVVDYCIKNDMYVIINIHHDGAEQSGWLRVATDDTDALYEKFAGVWNTIACQFKDYDEHLLFSSMNEVWGDDGSAAGVKRDFEVINTLNQIFVDTVRATGSNNAQRWLVCPGRYTNIDTTTAADGYKLPDDSVPNRLFVEIHYYDWSFGLSETMTITEWGDASSASLSKSINKLVDAFTSKGVPVIMGEYGAVNKGNPAARAKHMEVVNLLCKAAGVVPIYWDNGAYDRSKTPADYCFTLIDRDTLELVDPEVTYGIMRGYYADDGLDVTDIVVSPAVTAAEDISVDSDVIYMTVGERIQINASATNDGCNDVLLWTSSDNNVASVLNGGFVHAKSIGTSTITVASQSGSASKEVTVIVLPIEGSAKIDNFDGEFELELNRYYNLNCTLDSDYEYDFVTFASSNENIATVSSVGKVLAKNQGVAYITATSATGAVAVTKVTVVPPPPEPNDSIELAINVYYNDSNINYFSNEYSENTVLVTGDGQYSLTFDCAADLSENAIVSGVTGLNNLTAVYLKDYAIVLGKETKSYIESCNIMWDSVVVDGVELTVTQTEPKAALKGSGQFDTNDPINSWDGSYVEEVSVNDHVLTITAVDNPQVITVTFTISDLVFGEKTVKAAKPVTCTSFEPVGEASLSFEKAGAAAEITVLADNAKADIAFYSSNASVAAVSFDGTVNEDGSVSAVVTAVGKGDCTVIAITPDGLTVEIPVTCAADADTDENNTAAKGFSMTPQSIILIVCAVVIAAALATIIAVLCKNASSKKASAEKAEKK